MPTATRTRDLNARVAEALLGTGDRSPAEEWLTLQEHAERGAVTNPYQRSFTRFRTEMCYTKDEAAGGVRLMPDWAYLREMDDALIEERLLLEEKARRVLASWHCCCFDVWLCAGGQDRRWPRLLVDTGHRQVILAALKMDGFQSSSWFLENRVKFILDEFEVRGLRELWPTFPTWKWTAYQIQFSNGSVIDAVPQGADKLRGPGATFIHAEELAFWPEAQQSVNAALPVLKGGGHFCGITTPNVGSFAHRIVKGELKKAVWQ